MPIFNVCGTNYPYPNSGDKPWGVIHITWASAVSSCLTAVNTSVSQLQASQFLNPMLADGDIIIQASSIPARLPIGTAGQVLTVDVGGLPSWSAVGGTGDVVGPASAIDENIAVYDGVTGKLIKDGGITVAGILAQIPALSANYDLSPSSGIFNSTSASYVAITNLSVTITTTGNPVVLFLTGDGTNAPSSQVGITVQMDSPPDPSSNLGVDIQVRRDGSSIQYYRYIIGAEVDDPGLNYTTYLFSPPGFVHFDPVAAGTYTYSLYGSDAGSIGTIRWGVRYFKLVAYELK